MRAAGYAEDGPDQLPLGKSIDVDVVPFDITATIVADGHMRRINYHPILIEVVVGGDADCAAPRPATCYELVIRHCAGLGCGKHERRAGKGSGYREGT